MSAAYQRIRALAANPWLKWLAAPALVVAVVSNVIGVATLPPPVSLSAEPLYARGARAKPTLTLVLSVEFPTVGAQFLGLGGNDDDTYLPTNEYIGYFDAESCYTYNDSPGEARPAGIAEADYKRFDRTGDADRNAAGASLRTCNNAARTNVGFSGNFMNWASSSAIDILRRGLSGGDRIIDTSIANVSGFTVLQRAVLPTNFWNTNNFPSKRLKASLAAGAVPPVLLTTTAGAAWTNDVFVANCLNRIHFGTDKAGSCNAPGNNANLGVKVQAIPSNGSYAGPLPAGTVQVASENGSYSIAAGVTKQVFYGANSRWAVKTYTAGTAALTVNCTNANFGDPIPGTVKACHARDPQAMAAIPGVTADGFMYSRVRVCESNASGLLDPRKDLCLQYPSGSYKPVGNLQKYSDRVRVAAFGYLNDSGNNPQRYGGVLREPMKYVGAKWYDENFSLRSGTNPYQEWNEQTGELIAHPDAGDPAMPITEVRSGLINYLNQFGRTGPTPGIYKTYDPVGELYYEALRYLQGLPPTSDATTGMTTAMKDGFPVYTTWADPHPKVVGMENYSCVKNNIVGIGDVNTWNDKSIPGNTRTANDTAPGFDLAANVPNFVDWTDVIGKFESRETRAYIDGLGRTQTTAGVVNPNSAYPNLANMSTRDIGASGAAYYLAGMAYWANTHDIRGTNWTDSTSNPGLSDPLLNKQRPGMRVTTYFLDVNEFSGQTAATTHQQNQFFLAAKYGGFTDLTNTGNPFKVIGANSSASAPTTQPGNTYWEAAPAGSGETNNYFLSSSAKAVLTALDSIFASVAKQANSIAGAAVSAQQVTTADSYIYQSQFDASDWSGDVTSTPVSATAASGVTSVGSSASAPWSSAAAKLAAKVALDKGTSRKIYVGGGMSTTPAVEFTWGAAPTYVKTALRTPIGGTSATDAASVGEQRLNYLRGDQTNETSPGVFRKRGKLIGDIVNSGIAYSGAPSSRTTATGTYGTFYSDNANRKKALYVGANDGMLHAFDASTGDELFAYIPSWVVPKLSALTSPAYVHQSYVDASPAVADAKVGNDWKTVLVSGSGGGGQGVFALDVTNPDSSTFNAGKVLWEFSDVDDADLGNVIGKPRILALKTSSTGASKYFAVVASGVNNYVIDGRFSATGAAALFFLDLSKPATTAWSLNTNYFKIVLPTPSSAIANGLANFTPRIDSAGLVSAIYAGDLQGNMWKLDFTKATSGTSDWTMNKLSAFADTSSSRNPRPFFIATDGDPSAPARQPITMEPTLLYGPNNSVVVSFGTGKFLEVGDTSGVYKTQSVYAVMDDGTAAMDVVDTVAIAGRGRLQKGTSTGGVVDVPPFTFGRPPADISTVTPATAPRAGWYFDFPGSSVSGERQISEFQVSGNQLVFGSVIPSLNSCDNGGGNLYVVDGLTGDGSSQVSSVGIIGPPLVLPVADSSLSNTVTGSTGLGTQYIRYGIFTPGSSGLAPLPPQPAASQNFGRLSWREINNYQSLRPLPP